ncbi:MAG TPA: radical SAM protein [Syntrophorhabdaceae bacterium]|nr:radical SAM protein [Syntrophorhabdaceae bacterium]
MTTLNEKRALLVHPLGYGTESAGHDISRKANIMPPLGLASLAAYLKRAGIEADIVDYYANPMSDPLIRDYLARYRPAFIGLSCTTSSFLDGVRIAGLAKSVEPGIKTVFGGPHVSALKTRTLEGFPQVDLAVVGEGEETLKELIECGGETQLLPRVPGIVYRDGKEGPSFTGYRKNGVDLDSLPFPAYEKLPGYPLAYKLPIFNYPGTPNSSCISSRGCPYACSYCDRSVFRNSFRYNSAGYLYEHLKYLHERFHIRHVNFYDDQFTFNRQRVVEFTRMMIDKPLGMTFNCAVRAEHIDPELTGMMRQAGCWMISLGIETGDEELLARHRKNADLGMLAEKIRVIKKAGIRVKGLMMIGLPGETRSSIEKSMDYVFSLPVDDINVSKFTPFPGTPLYENAHELGTFDEDWPKMDCMSFLFIPKGMTKKLLERLFTKFYRKHIMRPKTLIDYVTMIWRSPDSWKRFISNIGPFLRFALTDRRIAGKNEKTA